MFDFVRFCLIMVPWIILGFRVLQTQICELEGDAYWGGNTVKAGKEIPRSNQTKSDENN